MRTAPHALEGNSAWAQRYARELRGVITRQAGFAPRSQQAHLGPSELGEECDRQVAAKFAAVTRTNHVSDPWPSIVGTAVHSWLAQAFNDDNLRENLLRWVTEVTVTPHEDYPGHADLYDAVEAAVIDHKVLGPTSLAKVKSEAGPPRRYVIQLLLYAAGFRALGLPVRRIALAAYPRTAATLDGMYVWERECGPEDEEIVAEVLARTEIRRMLGAEIAAGRMAMLDVPASPDDDACFFCPFYRPQSAYFPGPGCPGTVVHPGRV